MVQLLIHAGIKVKSCYKNGLRIDHDKVDQKIKVSNLSFAREVRINLITPLHVIPIHDGFKLRPLNTVQAACNNQRLNLPISLCFASHT